MKLTIGIDEKEIVTRASRADLNAACAASAVEQEWTIGGDRYAGDLGSAAHMIWTSGIAGRQVEISDAAADWQVDADELAALMRWGWREWGKIKAFFVPAKTEVPLTGEADGVSLSGRLDVLHLDGSEARICDGKTGRLEGDHDHQLRAYAWLVFVNHPEVEKVRVCIFRWRQQVADWNTYSREEIGQWWGWFARHLSESTIYRPGIHCAYCPRGATCPAKTALMRQSIEVLVSESATLPANGLDIELFVKLHAAAKLLKDQAEATQKLLKAEVIRQGGTVGPLYIREEKHRPISIKDGWRILQDKFGQEKLIELLEVSKDAVKKAVGDMAAPRMKGKDIAALMKQLDEAGALSTTIIQKLELRKGSSTNVNESISGAGAPAITNAASE